ncbi:OLC1v1011223C1 [Oldenlandia corymbosa var. corymbosa]|uniref:OLC1v1011223C1 n=1 Tax=Oldenlandia corymbosa var. corymbosa TaxID=529605 RepID=A0AAV1DT87_OLDCO|nr:OLC1v1011223C1 [Oldenlandia corymbosa var. corymbosa]
MGSKALQAFLAFSLLIVAAVSANDEEIVVQGLGSKIGTATPGKAYPIFPNPLNKAAPPPPPTPSVKAPPPPPSGKASPPPPPPPVKAPPPPPTPYPRNTKACYPLCLVRCKLHSRKKICLRACVTCCDRCKCVPPGQYGNAYKCGDGKCWANMKFRGRPKCP